MARRRKVADSDIAQPRQLQPSISHCGYVLQIASQGCDILLWKDHQYLFISESLFPASSEAIPEVIREVRCCLRAALFSAMSTPSIQAQEDVPEASELTQPAITPDPTPRVVRKAVPQPVARVPVRRNSSQQQQGQHNSRAPSNVGGINFVDSVKEEDIKQPNILHCGACKEGQLFILHHSVIQAEHARSLSNDPRNLVPHLQFGK